MSVAEYDLTPTAAVSSHGRSSASSRDARLESARVPRRVALTYPALALGAAMVTSVPGGARADETAADDSMVAALEASPVVEIPPEVGLAIDAGAPELGAPPAASRRSSETGG